MIEAIENYTSELIEDYMEYAELTIDGESSTDRLFIEKTQKFNNFSERFISFFNRKKNTQMTADEIAPLLKTTCSKMGANRNTIGNWITGKSIPIRNEKTRENLFRIAFAMKLSPEDTEEMFAKVFLDRAFNPRSKKEFIYYFCLKKGLDYDTACEILKNAVADEASSVKDIMETRLLRDSIESADSVQEIVDFIRANSSSFGDMSCTKGLKKLKEQYDLIASENVAGKRGLAEIESNLRNDLHKNDYEPNDAWLPFTEHGNEKTSVESILKVITQLDTRPESKEQYPTIDDESSKWNPAFCNEILIDFPGRSNIPEYIAGGKTAIDNGRNSNGFTSLDNSDSYNVRRWLILFHFYIYWAEAFIKCCKKNKTEEIERYKDLDNYTSEIDNLLYECGLPLLYAGNPYDWLFLYSASTFDYFDSVLSTDPIDTLRSILYNMHYGFE